MRRGTVAMVARKASGGDNVPSAPAYLASALTSSSLGAIWHARGP